MATNNLSNVIQHLRRIALLGCGDNVTDGQLLSSFIATGDQATFAVLVKRHAAMVWGVCRRLLDHHDAEDAFQAVYLVLYRKAASIKPRHMVANWLYGVAHKTAQHARRTAERRKARERRVREMPGSETVRHDDWADLKPLLDRELALLPDKYRAVIVLSDLEGKSRKVVAKHLGLPEGTVASRLARARALLAKRFARHGVTLSGNMLATLIAADSAAAYVPGTVVTYTIKAAGQLAAGCAAVTAATSIKVAALSEGVMTAMYVSKLKTMAAVLVVLTLGGVGGGLYTQRSSIANLNASDGQVAGREADVKNPDKPAQADGKMIGVRGQVLDPKGNPVVGAKLYVGSTKVDWSGERRFPVRAVSDKAGRFSLSVPKAAWDESSKRTVKSVVLATADGYGCNWAEVDEAVKALTLRLVDDLPINGRIFDPDGQPVAGAKLTMTTIGGTKEENLDGYLKRFRTTEGGIGTERHWTGSLPSQPITITDKDGSFRVAGSGKERSVRFRLSGPSIASTGLEVMTRPGDPVKNANKQVTIYGATFNYVGSSTRPIRGIVRDKQTGKPLAKITVDSSGGSWLKTVTDNEGRFELTGSLKKAKYWIEAKPADGLYFQRQLEIQDTPGLGALTCDIELVHGITCRGRVIDKETGQPIVGAKIDYHPLGGNEYVNKLIPGYWSPSSETTTESDGTYELTVMPGPGVIGVKAPKLDSFMPAAVSLKQRKEFFKTALVEDKEENYLTRAAGGGAFGGIGMDFYNALELVEPVETEKSLVKNVALQKPLERKGLIVDHAGRPLTGTTVYGLARFGIDTLKGDEFSVRGINNKAKRALVFHHKEKQLGFYLKSLPDSPDEVFTIKLQPCGSASGKLEDGDGKAVVGQKVFFCGQALRILGDAGGGVQETLTDKDGRFHVGGLVPGQEYRVIEGFRNFGLTRFEASVTVQPGEHKDLGTLKMADADPDFGQE